jgi:CheY-like chemotaxis protein
MMIPRQRPDLILLDIVVPGVFQAGARVPIIAAMNRDEARCLAAGMNAHLSKPIPPREFLDVVERHFGASGK